MPQKACVVAGNNSLERFFIDKDKVRSYSAPPFELSELSVHDLSRVSLSSLATYSLRRTLLLATI